MTRRQIPAATRSAHFRCLACARAYYMLVEDGESVSAHCPNNPPPPATEHLYAKWLNPEDFGVG